MKKSLTILFLFCFFFSKAQFPNNPSSGAPAWNSHFLGAVTGDKGVGLPVLADTTAWNLQLYTKTVPFIMVATSDGRVWYRNATATGWILYSTGGSLGTVTSVGLTVTTPASPAFSISNTPITTSGNIALNVLGTTSQYIRGDGSLATFLGTGWGLTGNAGTSAGTNFLGTTDAQDVQLKRNSVLGLTISSGKTVIAGNLELPQYPSTSTTGILYQGTIRMLHTFKGVASDGDNTFVGGNSGNFTMAGAGALASYNTGLGAATLLSLTTGFRNTANGAYVLQNNTTGFNNTGTGAQSLQNNTTGYGNTAYGTRALLFNTTGYQNLAYGVDALAFNTTGYTNVALGLDAGYVNTTGYSNTVVGDSVFSANTTGHENTVVGYRGMIDHLTGSYNTAIGDSTGQGIISGDNNTILGARVSGLSSTLANNIIIADGAGTQRLNFNSSGAIQFTGGGFGTSGQVLTSAGSGALPTWSSTPSITIPISSLTAATVPNTIANGDFGQVWNWDALSSSTALYLGVNSTAALGNSQRVLQIGTAGANALSSQTTTGMQIDNTHTGTSSTNIGIKVSASGGTNNYAALFSNGFVGIGTLVPLSDFHMAGSGAIATLGGGASAAELRFLEPSASGTNYSAFKAQAQGANITYTLPTTVGAAGTVLTDAAGNGTLSWAASGGSTPGIDATIAADPLLTTNRDIQTGGNKLTVSDVTNGGMLLLDPANNTALLQANDGTASGIIKVITKNGVQREWILDITDGSNEAAINGNASGGTINYYANGGHSFNADGSFANASAIMDIKSTEKGLLIPRMTEAQRDAISSPADWLEVVCTDCTPAGKYIYDGAAWVAVTPDVSALPYIALTGTSTMTGAISIDDASSGTNNFSIGVGTAIRSFVVTATNDVQFTNLSGTGTRAVLADDNGILSAPISDFTTKQNIHSLTNGLDILMKLKPVSFEYRNEFKNYGKGTQIGFIAQDIEKLLPNSTYTNFSNGKKGYNEIDLLPIAILAIQEQQKQIDELKIEINNLKNK